MLQWYQKQEDGLEQGIMVEVYTKKLCLKIVIHWFSMILSLKIQKSFPTFYLESFSFIIRESKLNAYCIWTLRKINKKIWGKMLKFQEKTSDGRQLWIRSKISFEDTSFEAKSCRQKKNISPMGKRLLSAGWWIETRNRLFAFVSARCKNQIVDMRRFSRFITTTGLNASAETSFIHPR